MGKVVGLTIVGLMVAIALDGLYANLMGRPWSMRPEPEILRVTVEESSVMVEPVSLPLEEVEGQTVHLIWTEPTPSGEWSQWLKELLQSTGLRSDLGVSLDDCETKDPTIRHRLVMQ